MPDTVGNDLEKAGADDRRDAERAGFEKARIENLLHFASLTPEQRVQWNWEMIQVMQAVKQRRSIGT